MRLAFSCAAAISLMTAETASAETWRLVAGNDEFNVVLDETSVRGGNYKSVWSAVLYKATQFEQDAAFDVMLMQTEIDCHNKVSRDLALVIRNEQGDTVYSRLTPGTQTAPIVPESTEEWLWKAVCRAEYVIDVPLRFDDLSHALRIARVRIGA